MTASLWFSVLLLFLRDAVGMNAQNAGIVMFSGQIADGIATPLVGVGSDASVCFPSLGMGRRKAWNAGGVVLVALCFTFIYAVCISCAAGGDGQASMNPVWQTVYYSVMASLFNFGWAAVQVSHMSMVPELTPTALGQTTLNAARYAMTILSNVSEFCALWALLHWLPNATQFDIRVYRYLAYGTVVVGLGATLLFLIFTPTPESLPHNQHHHHHHHGNQNGDGGKQAPGNEAVEGVEGDEGDVGLVVDSTHPQPSMLDSLNSDTEGESGAEEDGDEESASRRLLGGRGGGKAASNGKKATRASPASPPSPPSPSFGAAAGGVPRKGSISQWSEWFGREDLYVVGLNYMATRLVLNVAQVYLSFYVTVTLRLHARAIAISPLVMYLTSLGSTAAVRPLTSRIGRRWTYTAGALLCIASCVGFLLLKKGADAEYIVYGCAGVLGVGSGLIMVTAVSLEADLVAKNTRTGAFVYGILSLLDKVSNGVVILVIQIFDNKLCDTSVESEIFYRNILAYIPLAAAIVGCVSAYFVPVVAGHRCKACTRTTTEDEAREERIIE